MLKKLKAEPSAYVVRGATNILFVDKTLVIGQTYTNFIEGYVRVTLEEPLSDSELEMAKSICTPAGVSVITAALMSFFKPMFSYAPPFIF